MWFYGINRRETKKRDFGYLIMIMIMIMIIMIMIMIMIIIINIFIAQIHVNMIKCA